MLLVMFEVPSLKNSHTFRKCIFQICSLVGEHLQVAGLRLLESSWGQNDFPVSAVGKINRIQQTLHYSSTKVGLFVQIKNKTLKICRCANIAEKS